MSKYPNSGTLARNERREKDTHPEFTGKAEIDGVMYWISAWVKEGNGGKFFSLSFKPQQEPQAKKTGVRPTSSDDLSDVPF